MTDEVRQEALETNSAPALTASPEELNDIYLEWSDGQEDGRYVNDLVGAAEDVVSRAHEPRDVLGLACAAAITSTALSNAIDHQWALYTPQDAAVVASALRAQMSATAETLRNLVRAVEYLRERNEVELPDLSGLVTSEEENISDALDRIGAVADELVPQVEDLATATAALHRAPAVFQPARNVHENLRATVDLLALDAQIVGDEPGEDHGGEQCPCTAVITHGGEIYYLSYYDMEWSLLSNSDAVNHPDGTMSWINGGSIDIHVNQPLVHPRQLAEEVTSAVIARAE